MKAQGRIEDNVFSLYLEAETDEDRELIYRASTSALKPVVSFGNVNKYGMWAWFHIPVRQYSYRGFGNDSNK